MGIIEIICAKFKKLMLNKILIKTTDFIKNYIFAIILSEHMLHVDIVDVDLN